VSIEAEIQKTVHAAIEKAMEAKGGPIPGLPILGLLVGAPMMKSTEATLIDSLLGMLIGSLVDRGESDERIMARCEGTLRAIRTALADPNLADRAKKLVASMDEHRA
jgi:hypothetical protein